METALICPGCHKPMSVEEDPDMTFHKCASCGGIFLDKGELNELETGMAGDIEYNTLEGGAAEEDNAGKSPIRMCPRCQNQKMDKKALLVYSNIVLDHCPQCGGFYFHKGEVEEMNAYLQDLAKTQRPEKYRGDINHHLVTLDIIEGEDLKAGFGGSFAVPESISHLKITVYFKKPLALGLRIHSEKWTDRLMKLIGRTPQQTIVTGDKELDALYLIQGAQENQIKTLLSTSGIKKELLDLHQHRPKILTLHGSIEILDHGILYHEGPYAGTVHYDVQEDSAGVVQRLLRLACLFDPK